MSQNSNLSLVPLKRTLGKHKNRNQLIDDAITILKAIQDLDNLKRDPELILYIARLVENGDPIKDVDKDQLIVDVLVKLFPDLNNLQDVANIKNMIEFLRSNKRVKKISTIVSTSKKIGGWLFKKLA
jgi:hypothetical protein